MAVVQYRGKRYELGPGETVLEGLLRHGEEVAHSCRAGACQSCLLQAASGELPAGCQNGLKESRRQQGYFLACMARPAGDLVVEAPGVGLRVPARIASLDRLNPSVLRVRLAAEQPLDYRPGQYVTFLRPGLARSYSLASLPEEGLLEFHVRRIEGGRMSGWLHGEARVGDGIELQGPAGDCFYTPEKPQQPLLLAGAGTGLAPLYGILRDALRRNHAGPIWLYQGARTADGLYLEDELLRIAREHPQVNYVRCVLEGEPGADRRVASLDRAVLATTPHWAGWRGFLCGDPALVQNLKKRLFLAGMAMRDIHADAFLPSP